MVECCMTYANFEDEWEFCWRFDYHAPKDGKRGEYRAVAPGQALQAGAKADKKGGAR